MLQDIRKFQNPKLHKVTRFDRAQGGAPGQSHTPLPPDILTDYDLSPEGVERMKMLRKKNADRSRNVLSALRRAQLYVPELLTGAPQDVLEMSTAHGALLEVLRYHGHRVMGTDYAPVIWSSDPSVIEDGTLSDDTPRPDWPYRHVVDSVDLPMTLLDASSASLPFKDKSFDTVICYQSMANYTHPDDWMDLVEEFCRIGRTSVFVMLDCLAPHRKADMEYRNAFDRFRAGMVDFCQAGFTCTATFVEHDEVLGFKLTAS